MRTLTYSFRKAIAGLRANENGMTALERAYLLEKEKNYTAVEQYLKDNPTATREVTVEAGVLPSKKTENANTATLSAATRPSPQKPTGLDIVCTEAKEAIDEAGRVLLQAVLAGEKSRSAVFMRELLASEESISSGLKKRKAEQEQKAARKAEEITVVTRKKERFTLSYKEEKKKDKAEFIDTYSKSHPSVKKAEAELATAGGAITELQRQAVNKAQSNARTEIEKFYQTQNEHDNALKDLFNEESGAKISACFKNIFIESNIAIFNHFVTNFPGKDNSFKIQWDALKEAFAEYGDLDEVKKTPQAQQALLQKFHTFLEVINPQTNYKKVDDIVKEQARLEKQYQDELTALEAEERATEQQLAPYTERATTLEILQEYFNETDLTTVIDQLTYRNKKLYLKTDQAEYCLTDIEPRIVKDIQHLIDMGILKLTSPATPESKIVFKQLEISSLPVSAQQLSSAQYALKKLRDEKDKLPAGGTEGFFKKIKGEFEARKHLLEAKYKDRKDHPMAQLMGVFQYEPTNAELAIELAEIFKHKLGQEHDHLQPVVDEWVAANQALVKALSSDESTERQRQQKQQAIATAKQLLEQAESTLSDPIQKALQELVEADLTKLQSVPDNGFSKFLRSWDVRDDKAASISTLLGKSTGRPEIDGKRYADLDERGQSFVNEFLKKDYKQQAIDAVRKNKFAEFFSKFSEYGAYFATHEQILKLREAFYAATHLKKKVQIEMHTYGFEGGPEQPKLKLHGIEREVAAPIIASVLEAKAQSFKNTLPADVKFEGLAPEVIKTIFQLNLPSSTIQLATINKNNITLLFEVAQSSDGKYTLKELSPKVTNEVLEVLADNMASTMQQKGYHVFNATGVDLPNSKDLPNIHRVPQGATVRHIGKEIPKSKRIESQEPTSQPAANNHNFRKGSPF